MPTSEDRKRRGQEIIKKYRPISGTDPYAAATDAITDILMFVAQSTEEAIQLLHCAEVDYTSTLESEDMLSEG